MSLFLTSDHHLGHTRIIEYCSRPFSSVEHMNDTLVDAWNSCVSDDDYVLHLGDVAFLKRLDEHTVSSLKKLRGKKVLVRGNHDRDVKLLKQLGWCVHGGKYKTAPQLNIGDITFVHNPDKAISTSKYVFHGHCHGTRGAVRNVDGVVYCDMGVDVSHNFEPVQVDDAFGLCAEELTNCVADLYERYTCNNMFRADGECTCESCGLVYRKHPMDEQQLSGIDGTQFLHVLCDGKRVKL